MDPEVMKSFAEQLQNAHSFLMIAPVVAAALIGGGASLLGSLFGGGKQKEAKRIPDPYRDPLLALLSQYYQGKVGQERPAYTGELSAPYNEALMAAIGQAMMQTGGYADPIASLITRFSSPSGAQGWNPVASGWNRAPESTGSMAGISPEIAAFVASRMGRTP